MRWVVLLGLLPGCQQIFGLSDPTLVDAAGDDARAQDSMSVDPALYPTCAASLDMIACFDFNSDTTDHSADPNPTTTASISFVPGLQGQALALTTTSKVTIADSSRLDTTAVTIEAWVDPSTLPVNNMRMGIWDTDGQYGMFIHQSGTLGCTGGGGTATISVVGITTGAWSHIACAVGNDEIRGYINGKLALSGTLGMPIPTSPVTGAEIGGNAPDMLDRFDGNIDLLRVYRVVRTADEICTDAHCK